MKLSNNKLLLIALSILCFAMIVITTVRDEWLSPLRTAVGYVLMPVQSGVNRVGKALYRDVKDREMMRSALSENKQLKLQLDALTQENTRLESDRFELRRLRALYQLNQNYGQYRMTGARVIAKDTGGWFHIFRIDKGSADGIRVDMNVIAGGGLVGIVMDVGANYATVRSIIDDVSRVSAMALQSGDTCIVSGDLQMYADGRLKLSDITDTADIKDGDKIVTSTISAKFLPGILIGYADGIKTDPTRLTRSGSLIPVADFGTIQEVLVILDRKADLKECGDSSNSEEALPVEEKPEPSEAVEESHTAGGIVPVLEETTEAPRETGGGRETERAETKAENRNETRRETPKPTEASETTRAAAAAPAAEERESTPPEGGEARAETEESVMVVESLPEEASH